MNQVTNNQNQTQHGEGHNNLTNFFVNGEICVTSEHKLTVREILAKGGFTPGENYRLTRDNGNKTFTNMNEELPIHNGEHFTATYVGPTQVS